MVRKIAIWFIVLFIGINGLLYLTGDVPFILDNPAVKIRNDYKFEEFLRKDSSSVYFIGSSLAASLHPDYIDNSRNLGVEGSNAIVAHKLVEQFEKKPKTVIIETNTLFDIPDSTLLELFNSYKYKFGWNAIPSMRIKNRLITDGIMYSSGFYMAAINKLPRKAINRKTYPNKIPLPKRVEYSIEEVVKKVNKLKDYYASINCSVVFVEIPSPKLSPEIIQKTDELISVIDAKKFIRWDDSLDLEFPDGTHFSDASTIVYSKWLQNQLK